MAATISNAFRLKSTWQQVATGKPFVSIMARGNPISQPVIQVLIAQTDSPSESANNYMELYPQDRAMGFTDLDATDRVYVRAMGSAAGDVVVLTRTA